MEKVTMLLEKLNALTINKLISGNTVEYMRLCSETQLLTSVLTNSKSDKDINSNIDVQDLMIKYDYLLKVA